MQFSQKKMRDNFAYLQCTITFQQTGKYVVHVFLSKWVTLAFVPLSVNYHCYTEQTKWSWASLIFIFLFFNHCLKHPIEKTCWPDSKSWQIYLQYLHLSYHPYLFSKNLPRERAHTQFWIFLGLLWEFQLELHWQAQKQLTPSLFFWHPKFKKSTTLIEVIRDLISTEK